MGGGNPSIARSLALQILCEVERDIPLERALDQCLAGATLETRDRALLTHLVQGSIRLRRYLDWVIGHYTSRPVEDLPSPIRNTLRLAVYQLLYLDRIPDRAVVNDHVSLAFIHGHRGTAGLVNAVLRSFLRAGKRIPVVPRDDPVTAIGVETSHPDWLIRRWIRRFGENEARVLASAGNQIPEIVIRVNRLRASPEELRERLLRGGVETRQGEANPGVLYLSGAPSCVQDLPGFDDGWFQVQDESSSLVGLLAGPSPGNRVVDLCSGVGGKTSHLVEQMRDDGLVVAVDRAMWRLRRLRDNCRRLGVESVFALRADVTVVCVQPSDVVLLDAPCSGTGVLARRSDARWRREEADIPRLARLQSRMLAAASSLVKEGGWLVYSVCSLEPEEGEDVVHRFMSEHAGFRLENAGGWLPGTVVDGGGFLQTFPHHHGMDGIFAARLRKAGRGVGQ
ncbi:MAG: 16S rRNA (cytosine(967)-C(5))-methyltransferase RsmB [Candidatus Eisenbacteria sp.]|nr:16S rRNA (cytosine(967)-C(5))-methyltransferase RsmB [Candidatus Eisenbacteria bacterium]